MEQLISAVVQELMQALGPVLVAALLALVGWGAEQLRRLHINATVARALARAAGVAYLSLVEQRRGADPTAIARAVGEAADFVRAGPTVAPLLPKAGITPERLEDLLRAEIGKALMQDQGVTVGAQR